MRSRISKRLTFLAAVIGVCTLIGIAGAQLYPGPFSFVDVKSNGTRIHLLGSTGPKVHYINFVGGATLNASTSSLDVTSNWAAVAPTPTPSPNPGWCGPSTFGAPATLRSRFYTVQGATGTKDLTYQCCQTSATPPRYVWIAGYCN